MTKLELLAEFAAENRFLKSRGALNLGLVLTRRAREDGLPLDAAAQLAPSGGQVRGLNGAAGDAILRDYGVTRSIGTEVGRTNRGSLGNMTLYVEFLNEHAIAADLPEFERYWVDQFIQRFALAPFRLRRQPGASIQSIIRDLLGQADERQRETAGAMIVGTVVQHLVGAKLEAALDGRAMVVHHGANVSDAQGRGGDFDIGDTALHVTLTPGELLIRKCDGNIRAGRRPAIVTVEESVAHARTLASRAGIGDQLEIYAVDQFIALNVSELGLFEGAASIRALHDIVERYNRIIDAHEHDPSLRIAWD